MASKLDESLPPEELLEILLAHIYKLADEAVSSDPKAQYRFKTIKKRASNAHRIFRSMQETSQFSVLEFQQYKDKFK